MPQFPFRRPWILAAVAAAMVAGVLAWLAADDRGEHGERVVRVGLYENAPKIYTNEHGEAAGLFVELLREIARLEGWQLDFHPCEWSACLDRLSDGRLDLMPDVAFSAERSQRFDYHANAAAHSWSQIYTRRDRHVLVLADLADRRIAVMRGAVQEARLDRLMAEAGAAYERVPVSSLAEGFAAVRDGAADAVVANNFFAGWHNRDYGLAETPIVFNPVGLYFATAKGRNGELLAAVDSHLGEWRERGDSFYYDAVRRAMTALPMADVPLGLWWLLGGASVLALLLGLATGLLRRQASQRGRALRIASRRLDHLLTASPAVLYALRQEADDRLRATWVSGNIGRIFGFAPEEAAAPGWWESRLHPEDVDTARQGRALLRHHGHLALEYRLIDARGTVRHVRDEMQLIRSATGDGDEIVGTWSDLTETREQEARVSYLINHDLVTGLPNRILLRDRLEHALQHAHGEGNPLALLFLDLDRFKNVNDTLGHRVGDEVLKEAARRIAAHVRPEDTLARVGNDDFVVLLEENTGPHHASAVTARLLDSFARPIEAGGHALVITASIGISLFPEEGAEADTLLAHAELAMYEAKRRGGNGCQFFVPGLSEGVARRLLLENALRKAVSRNELALHYQPQLALADRRLVGVEALVRWNHPELGMVPPVQFIGLAEEIGIIGEIDAWVLGEACRQLAAWDRDGFAVPRVAVNLSVQELEGEALVRRVEAALAGAGLDADRLELEVTESMIMRAPEQAAAILSDLKDLGVCLAVDDFGTGYSSLAYLKRLPLDRLKIDRSFVSDIGHSANDEAIVRAVIALARSMGLETVAEGVEDAAHVAFLGAEGCEMAQGYLFGRPMPAEALRETFWPANGRRTARAVPPGAAGPAEAPGEGQAQEH